jgi:DNA-binding transcriptional ArsR family regulator
MPSSSSRSPDEHDGLLRRFLVASRRAEIVALINGAHSEGDLGAVVATELCEAYDAEIGFVLIARPDLTTAELIGRVGLIDEDPARIFAEPLCRKALSGAVTVTERGTDLLGLGIRHLALAPHTAGGAQLLVGVGRLYNQQYDDLELALLEAVTKSSAQALERFGLERQLQQAHEMEAVAHLGGGVVHQLYCALATIIGHCDLGTSGLHRGAPEAEAELREIRAAAESAAKLVQRLLAVSRQQAPQPLALDVNALGSQAPAEMPLPVDAQLGSLVYIFRLLGQPIRLRILVALGSDTLSPSELQQRLDIGLGNLAYHVGVLRDDGLLELVETRASRGALESFYRLTDRGEFARSVIAATWREMSDTAER